MGLSNFGRKKAGKLGVNAGFWEILGAGSCARKFEFLEILCYNKRLGIELGARISPKGKSKFDKKENAGCATKI